jgi:hypothetical protein
MNKTITTRWGPRCIWNILCLACVGRIQAEDIADDYYLGLGSTAGRIQFDDQATDEVTILLTSA